ncbi:MAG: twin-arginine translocase subunit TatC [Caldilineaceae bacterium]|nr:twin-arginine translocase subunit TatC [Caldilineaceae bacterium]
MTTAQIPNQEIPQGEGGQMSIMDHLRELRTRLIWIFASLVVGTLLGMVASEWVVTAIVTKWNVMLQAISPFEPIAAFFRVSVTLGVAFATPMITYQILGFIVPGLYPHEKRSLLYLTPAIFALFLCGGAFAYYVMLPVAVAFLQQFWSELIEANWSVREFVFFTVRITFWIGVFFELPLVMAFLARIGIVSGPKLLGWWRYAIVLSSVVAAIITPTIDPVNMAIALFPLILLYFIGVGLAYLLYRPREPRDFSESEDEGQQE